MKKVKQILAWIGIILLAAMYLVAFVCSLFKSPLAATLFRAALGCTIIIPVFLYLILMIAKSMRPKKSELIDAVIFDMGKVLLDYPWDDHPDDFDFSPECTEYLRKYVNPSPLWRKFDFNNQPFDDIVEEFVQQKPEYAEEIRVYIHSMHEIIKPFWFTKDLIQALRRKGYKVYYLSNWCREHYELLTANGTLDFVKSMNGGVWSFEIHSVKPDRKIFDALKERYHLVPDRCVFIDDSADNVKAARKLGYASIQFTDYTDMVEKLASIGVVL